MSAESGGAFLTGTWHSCLLHSHLWGLCVPQVQGRDWPQAHRIQANTWGQDTAANHLLEK